MSPYSAKSVISISEIHHHEGNNYTWCWLSASFNSSLDIACCFISSKALCERIHLIMLINAENEREREKERERERGEREALRTNLEVKESFFYFTDFLLPLFLMIMANQTKSHGLPTTLILCQNWLEFSQQHVR